ncbi:MAG: endo alpha-1,4 polygalactosaminidase [Deltaproteobacteria bacterium]|nr:endo alpha-1,4 polygalactosaminidase [Deltaproteobacteria bacterium]
MPTRRATVLLGLLWCAGCLVPPWEWDGLDPNVPPVTEGSWYRPTVDTTWTWQLRGTLNESYDVQAYDVDLFDTPRETISRLKQSGRRVICYFSAGSSEDWREDDGDFHFTDRGLPMAGWAGERWLNIRSETVMAVMQARLARAVEKGCDGVEPDNVDGYANATGFHLSAADQRAFNRALANDAHRRGLTVALKNCGGLAPELVAYFDLSLNEQCHELNECGELQPFLDAGKPVFNAEYQPSYREDPGLAELCARARADRTRTLVLALELDDSFRASCDP